MLNIAILSTVPPAFDYLDTTLRFGMRGYVQKADGVARAARPVFNSKIGILVEIYDQTVVFSRQGTVS